MNTAAFLIFLFLFLASVLLQKAYRTFPLSELRRKARSGKDPESTRIYKLSAYGYSVEITLWLIGGLSAGGLFLVAAKYSWWAGLSVILISSWIIWLGRPLSRYGNFAWSLASYLAPLVLWLVSILHPFLLWVASKVKSFNDIHIHTGIYEKDDLLDLLNKQNHQVDSRVSESELKMAAGALTFGDKTVLSAMIPRRVVRVVSGDEMIGPMLMDELHASGFSRFPVVKGQSEDLAEIVGTLYLRDLLNNLQKPGTAADIMKKDAAFINETHSLRQALDAFSKTQHHLLIVVNNFEEFVGVLTLEDVLEQILGEKIVDEFDHYEDLRAVAGKEAHDEHNQHEAG